MKAISFPKHFRHEHPPIRNVNEIVEERLAFPQRAADWVACSVGSWRFVLIQSALLLIWIIANITAFTRHWDPYPFILMNLVLSMQAAYTAPVIMMSQNRQANRDRIEAHNDYLINQKAEEEIRLLISHLEAQNEALLAIHQSLLNSPATQGEKADPD